MDPDDDDKFDDDQDDLEDNDDSDDDDSTKTVEYTEEEYREARSAKAKRLFKEDKGRLPYNVSELSHFIMSADIERPIEPEDCDFDAIRKSS